MSLSIWALAIVVGACVVLLLWSPEPLARFERSTHWWIRVETWVRHRWNVTRDDDVGMAVIDLLVAMSAEVRSGADVSAAFDRAVAESPTLQHLTREDLAHHRHRGLRLLAVAWQVHDQTGGPTLHALTTLIDLSRADLRVQRAISSESSAARATAVVLVGLTPVAWVVGSALGAQPVAWLVHSALGLLVLGVGLMLTALGLASVAVLIRRVRARVREAS